MKNKRGSHVGVILSFAIFVTFVVFMYSILEPSLNLEKDKEAFLDYVRLEILDRLSSNFTSLSVSINSGANPSEECIRLGNFFVLLAEQIPGYGIKIKDEDMNMEEGFHEGFAHLVIDRDDSDKTFFRIYYSPEFDNLESKSGCSNVTDEDYSLSLIKTGSYVFKNKVKDFIENYNSDYENVKEDLRIPPGTEFDISFTESNETIISTEEKEISGNVYAREIPVQYIDEDSNILLGIINVRIW